MQGSPLRINANSALICAAQRWGLVTLACLMGRPFANCSFEGANASGVGAGIWEGGPVPLDQTDGGGSGSIHLALWEQQSLTSNNKNATCWPQRLRTNTQACTCCSTCAFIRAILIDLVCLECQMYLKDRNSTPENKDVTLDVHSESAVYLPTCCTHTHSNTHTHTCTRHYTHMHSGACKLRLKGAHPLSPWDSLLCYHPAPSPFWIHWHFQKAPRRQRSGAHLLGTIKPDLHKNFKKASPSVL